MPRKDRTVTPSVTKTLQSLGYQVSDWDDSASTAPDEVKDVFKTASKQQNGMVGYPDRVYYDAENNMLILVEEKPTPKEHDLPEIDKGAVSGIKWYLSRFLNANLSNKLKGSFNGWKILGIAASGDFTTEFANKFSAYYVDTEVQKVIAVPQLNQFVERDKFLAVFNNLDEEKAISQVAKSSHKINNMLRSVDSQKRPVLLSALMISLHNTTGFKNDFPEIYKTISSPTMLINYLIPVVKKVLEAENIPAEKIRSLDDELAFIKNDENLSQTNLLKDILVELDEAVIPLFDSKFADESNYDIIGKFYEDFLSYAGVSNVKKGIVLTPRHVTTLFTKLIPIKENDVILDLASGTGAFLIAGMNAIIAQIKRSQSATAEQKIANVKKNQLVGFEINPTMYISSISNMLFRGDGKSAIYNMDSIKNPEVQNILDKKRPTIGFINPPYSGKENKSDPTPKEITFLKKMLKNVSRYGVIIAPVSMYFKDKDVRNEILRDNTLKYVINMPDDLFMPNAATHTAIAVFETHRPHDYENDEVKFYDLKDDGFALVKNKGRSDVYGKWDEIEKHLLDSLLTNKVQPDGLIFEVKKIGPTDEWTVQQHTKVDYSNLSHSSFINTIANFVMFSAKKEMNVLTEKMTEFGEFKLLSDYFSGGQADSLGIQTKNNEPVDPIDTSNWKEFHLVGPNGLFPDYDNGRRLTVPDRTQGELPLLTAGEYNQGLTQYIGNYDDVDFDHQFDDETIEKWAKNGKKPKPYIVENALTIDMFFNVFYQNYRYATDDNVYSFKNDHINMWTALFIATILKQQQTKYGYGRQFRKENAEQTTVMLPVNAKGNPDYLFMEQYMSSLPYADLL